MKRLLVVLSFVCLSLVGSLAEGRDLYSIGLSYGRRVAAGDAYYNLPRAKEGCLAMWWFFTDGMPDPPSKDERTLFVSGCVDGYMDAWDKKGS